MHREMKVQARHKSELSHNFCKLFCYVAHMAIGGRVCQKVTSLLVENFLCCRNKVGSPAEKAISDWAKAVMRNIKIQKRASASRTRLTDQPTRGARQRSGFPAFIEDFRFQIEKKERDKKS